MNRGTIIMVALALGSLGLAWSSRPTEAAVATFADTGEALFPGFTDPSLATSLEVVSWDDKGAKVERFAVEQKSGRWVIPSHNDYPADGTERMGKAAASFIDVKKDIYYGDNAGEHGQFGVLDPAGEDGKGDEKGKHVIIKDASGALLVDVIVGKAVPDKQGYFYVRGPSEKRVYGARLELDISTNFADWIEKDLLKVKREELVAMIYDPYAVDEGTGRVMGSKPIRADLEQVDGKDEWVVATGVEIPEGKILDSAKVRQVVTAVASIKIVGVRPRPKPLTLQALQSKGFFVTPDQQRLFGNEGEARIVTKDGLVFSLYFGEITYESGLALTAGTEQPEDAAPAGDSDGGDPEAEKQANRYMFVEVAYDPSLDKQGDGVSAIEEPAEPEGADDKPALKGAERAAMLQKRFSEWFYVISDASFKQIHKERGDMFKVPPVPKDGAKPAGGPPMPMEGMGGAPVPAAPTGDGAAKPPKAPAAPKPPKPKDAPAPSPTGDTPPGP